MDIIEGSLFDANEKFQNAKNHLEKSHEIDKKNPETVDNHGVFQYHLGEYEQAFEYFKRANEIDPKSKIIWYHIGRAQTKLKKYKHALISFDKALELDLRFAEAHNGKAIVYYQLKKYDEAANEAKKALEINPDLAVADENLGKLALLTHTRVHESFWEFWQSSKYKKIIAIAIAVAITVSIYLYTYHIYFGNDESIVEVYNGTVSPETIINSTKTINDEPSDIPEAFLIVIALMLFIILLPEIRKAKLGPVEVELKEEDVHLIRDKPSLPPSADIL